MMKIKTIFAPTSGAVTTLSSVASAQDKVTMSGNIGSVSNYIWCGMDQNSGFSVQSSSGLSYKGSSPPAWCNQSLIDDVDCDAQELDISLSYSTGGLSATLTGYWQGGLHNPYGHYKQDSTDNPIDGDHHFEATVAYNFSTKLSFTLS